MKNKRQDVLWFGVFGRKEVFAAKNIRQIDIGAKNDTLKWLLYVIMSYLALKSHGKRKIAVIHTSIINKLLVPLQAKSNMY